MADSSLIKKLLVKPGQRMTIMNPPTGYVDKLGPLPEGVEIKQKSTGEFDLVHLFAKNSHELERLVLKATKVLKYDGIFWISYPRRALG